jgi:hypothetical protein
VSREPELCPRCKCCEVFYEDCGHCEDGFIGHDCGEDCCCCEYPEDNVPCGVCGGSGYFAMCIGRCDIAGKHVGTTQTERAVSLD